MGFELEKITPDNVVPRFAKGTVGEILNKIREANLAKKGKIAGDILQTYREATGGIEEIIMNNRKITIGLVYFAGNNPLTPLNYISSTYATKEKAKDKQYHYLFNDLIFSNAVTNTYSQNKPCLFFYISESDAEVFEKYLKLIKNEPLNVSTGSTIQSALNAMEQLTDKHIPYEQETSPRTLRTDETPEALAKMDCSEFVSRYLKAVGLFDNVPDFTTATLANVQTFAKLYDDKLQFLEGSDEADFKDIQAGDIFVWREGENGHTGMVIEYKKELDVVEVYESIGHSGSSDETFSISHGGDTCKGCTRKSVYRRNRTDKSGALYGHPGWKGYYRPVINK